MCTHLKVLNESFPMNTNMTGFGWFAKIFASLCALYESSLSIGRVKGFGFSHILKPLSHAVATINVTDEHPLPYDVYR